MASAGCRVPPAPDTGCAASASVPALSTVLFRPVPRLAIATFQLSREPLPVLSAKLRRFHVPLLLSVTSDVAAETTPVIVPVLSSRNDPAEPLLSARTA
ncbi:hypothetical protein D3C87_1217270 [compost metagenome]